MTSGKVFISYAREDEKWFQELSKHLGPLARTGLITPWSDKDIRPGDRWHEEISRALDEASIAVLLITQNFLNSTYISDFELPRILRAERQRRMRVLNVFVEASLVDQVPYLFRDPESGDELPTRLSEFQGLNDVGAPLSDLSRKDRTTALVNIARKVLEQARALSPAHEGLPHQLFNGVISRSWLFGPLLDFAKKRDTVFIVGGKGSGLGTFIGQLRRYLLSEEYSVYPADFDPSIYRQMKEARVRTNAALQGLTQYRDNALVKLKCLLSSMAYSVYHGLREVYPVAMDDLVPPAVVNDPVAFFRVYLNDGVTLCVESEPVVEHFFRSLQRYAEVCGIDRVLVLMPWEKLSECFSRPNSEEQRDVAKELWNGLSAFVTRQYASASLQPWRGSSIEEEGSKYDKVCMIVGVTQAPIGENPYKRTLVSRAILPMVPMQDNEIVTLLSQLVKTEDAEDIATVVKEATGGSPWFIRLLLTFFESQCAPTDKLIDTSRSELRRLLDRSVEQSEAFLMGATEWEGPSESKPPVVEYTERYIERVMARIGTPDVADSRLLEYWLSRDEAKRNRGIQMSPRLEAWLGTGLIWLDPGFHWSNLEDYIQGIFREFPVVFLQRAATLPLAFYRGLRTSGRAGEPAREADTISQYAM